jgi:hypothetical protein
MEQVQMVVVQLLEKDLALVGMVSQEDKDVDKVEETGDVRDKNHDGKSITIDSHSKVFSTYEKNDESSI